MKRNQMRNGKNEAEGLIYFPVEILCLISNQVWKDCVKVTELLNWCSTCTIFWNEFLDIGDTKMIEFIVEKRTKNKMLMQRTFSSLYQQNMIGWSKMEFIVAICTRVKSHISLSVAEHLDTFKVINNRTSFVLDYWQTWPGMAFCEEILQSCSLNVLNGVDSRLRSRYDWRVSFMKNHGDDKGILSPFSKTIRSTYFFTIEPAYAPI